MSTVTYKAQPSVHATRGAIPEPKDPRTSHMKGSPHNGIPYRVTKLLWPGQVEAHLQSLFVGRVLHLCCGKSKLGHVRLDIDPLHEPDILADAAHTKLKARSYDTVLCDPPYNGDFQWNHDLLSEMARLARQRIIFQHWFIPADRQRRYKKNWDFRLVELYNWMPVSYFGRVQVISVFDHV